ncbi:IbpA Molecular chaperone (small heat shock protein) [uncultured Caudovirales phage]|uniref:IbpA Molecular chaperone (Small heat shock protein) n=1 Tax=uncultured Caudovirales phage TaxID=2100421 RepID=A0A6J5L1Q1_9CAUD|nr:IbpA Molecular chaperone (small heat shock protein) [uncultured Caudovirales phage]
MIVNHSTLPYFNQFLGLERILDDIEKHSTQPNNQAKLYPPHNIIKTDDYKYTVELAVAGFKQEELDITVEDGVLIITGTQLAGTDSTMYLHKGISTKDFRKTIRLADTVVVNDAQFVDGILSIYLENVIPEAKKPRKILIGNGSEKLVLLNEKEDPSNL